MTDSIHFQDMLKECNSMKKMMDELAKAKAGMLDDAFDGFDPKEVEDYLKNGCQGLGLKQGKCSGCGGEGCGACGGSGSGTGPGTGGEGTGRGGRPPEIETPVSFSPTKVSGKTGKGKILGHFFVRGVPPKGDALTEYTEEVTAAKKEATDALENENIPQSYEESVKKYLMRLRLKIRKNNDYIIRPVAGTKKT